ncbi:MAG: NRDE family protein [Burkholderiales bacterium]|nr:NRDE family protein [Burkholderiales bacterium]
MCLILFSFRAHRHFPLVVAANRDEHFSRPAAAAAFWDDHPAVYAGRDLEQGGTWMGISTSGRFAAVTNYRQGRPGAAAPRSRGALVSNFLTGDTSASSYMAGIEGHAYNPYSLIAGDLDGLHFQSNRSHSVLPVTPGIHGLSNHLLDTPWPKVTAGMAALAATRDSGDPDAIGSALFALLSERMPAQDAHLPDTGIDRQRERELSPPFILGSHYGTRTSTLLLVHASGEVFVHEKRYGPGGVPQGEDARAFRLERAAHSITS